MDNDSPITVYDFIDMLSRALDIIDPMLAGHHQRTAYFCYKIGQELGMDDRLLRETVVAALLHDIGHLSTTDCLSLMHFTLDEDSHARLGARLLQSVPYLDDVADIILNHHVWHRTNSDTPLGARTLHLADRIEILLERGAYILNQKARVRDKVERMRDKMFDPDVLDAFQEAAKVDAFWLEAVDPSVPGTLSQVCRGDSCLYPIASARELMLQFCRLIAQTTDFRSNFTATHTMGVAHTARILSSKAGFSPDEQEDIFIAGQLHDLGKLAIPRTVLDKPGKLTQEEYSLVRSHTFHTYKLMNMVPSMEKISRWAAYHHERINGKGYPFALSGSDLDEGSRIMAVADVFTAVTEDRPYRMGMHREQTMAVLGDMANNRHLDPDLVALLAECYKEVTAERIEAQDQAGRAYVAFYEQAETMPLNIR